MSISLADIWGMGSSLVGKVGDFFNPSAAINRQLIEANPHSYAETQAVGGRFIDQQVQTGGLLIGAAALGGGASLLSSQDDGSSYDTYDPYSVDDSYDDGSGY